MNTLDKPQNILTSYERALVILSCLIVVIAPFASDSYTPSMPSMAHALGTTTAYMQLTMTAYLAGLAISQLIYGPLSDRFGRKPIILIGLSITTIGSILCGLSETVSFIVFARFVQGAGAGVSNALFRALMRDQFTGHKMSQIGSYSGMLYTLSFASAPVIGGYIEIFFGWRANFYFVGFLVLIVTLLLWFKLPETHLTRDITATNFKNILRNYYSLLASPDFAGFTIISGLAYSGFVAYYTAGPFLLENHLGLTPTEFGWMSLIISIGLFIGMFVNVRLVVSLGVERMLFLGLVVMGISSFAMLIFGLLGFFNTYVIIIPIIFFAGAASFVFANAMTHAFHCVGHIAGSAGGMYGFLQILIASLTSIFVARLHEQTQIPLAVTLTTVSLIAIVLFWMLNRRSRAH